VTRSQADLPRQQQAVLKRCRHYPLTGRHHHCARTHGVLHELSALAAHRHRRSRRGLPRTDGLHETTGGTRTSFASPSGTPSLAEQGCLRDVTRETNNPDVVMFSSSYSEAGTEVIVGVGPQLASWRCIGYRDGTTAGIMSLTDEGAMWSRARGWTRADLETVRLLAEKAHCSHVLGWVELAKPSFQQVGHGHRWVSFLNPAYSDYLHGLSSVGTIVAGSIIKAPLRGSQPFTFKTLGVFAMQAFNVAPAFAAFALIAGCIRRRR